MTSSASPDNHRREDTRSEDARTPSSAPTTAWDAARGTGRGAARDGKAPGQGRQKVQPSAQSAGRPQSGDVDKGQLAIIVLVVLGVIASVVMLLVGSVAALKIALLVLMWAAVLGMFLVVRYRRQAEDSSAALRKSEDAHRAELDRLTAQQKKARPNGAQQAPASTAGAFEGSGLSEEDVEMLREIRAEIATIREQLEDLSGREFTYEPAALRAEARRIMEIEARAHVATRDGSAGSAAEPASPETAEPAAEFDFTQASSGAPSADAIAGRLGTDGGATARPSEELRDIVAERAAGEEKPGSSAGHHRAPEAEGDAAAEPERSFDTGSFQAVKWTDGGDAKARRSRDRRTSRQEPHATEFRAVHAEPAAAEKNAGAAAEPDTAAQAPRRGRRRRDSGRSEAVSVAELLAANKKRK